MPTVTKSMRVINRCQTLFHTEKLKSVIRYSYPPLIYAICRQPGRSQEELAKELYLEKSSVARVLNRMEEEDFVTRISNAEDKRQLLIYPTQKMLDFLEPLREAAREWNALITEGISPEEMAIFQSVLERIERRAKAIVDKKGDL